MTDYVVDGQNGLYADDPSSDAISCALIRFFEGWLGSILARQGGALSPEKYCFPRA